MKDKIYRVLVTKRIFLLFFSALFLIPVVSAEVPIVSVYDDDTHNGYFKVVASKGMENGHEWVNLGQEMMWATVNIGANSPTDKGDLYAWGETELNPTMSEDWYGSYQVSNYVGDRTQLQLSLSNDAAHVNWGGGWRMPSLSEWNTLMNNCIWTWKSSNNKQGYMVSNGTDSVFLIQTYDAYNVAYSSFYGDCAFALYWSSTRDPYTTSYAKAIGGCQYSGGPSATTSAVVEGGHSIRPICKPSINDNIVLYLKKSSSTKIDTIIPEMGQEIQLKAEVSYGYHFVRWNDDNTDNPRTIIMTQDSTFTAEFSKNSYTITTESSNSEWGTTAGDKSALYLDEVEISATANYGYHFVRWNDGNTQNPRIVTVTDNTTYQATFAKNVYSITKNAEHGTISGNSSAEYLDFVTLTVTPDYGYHFTQWSDGLKDNPRIFQITQDTTFTAEFAPDRVGTCGKDLALVWSYDPTNKVLTIGNAGSFTENMQFGLEAPNEMEELVIGNSVTAIGTNAFAGISSLKKVSIGESVKTIGEQAFYNCVNLETIFNYRPTPTNAYSTAFDGVDKFECILYVLPNSIDMYKNASVWRDFYYTYAIGAEEATVITNEVMVEPQDNAATLTWPTSNEAFSYTIEITKDGVVFCRLTFNANGQLTGIAFAPGRDGQSMAPAAVMTANGLQFTVTGLDSNTQYGYSLTAKDANEQPIASYSGSFTTTSEGIATGVEEVSSSLQGGDRGRLILRNGQIFILRGDKIYNAQGALVK